MTSISTDALPPGFILLQVTPRLEGGGVEETTLAVAAEVVRAGGGSLVASEGGRLEGALSCTGARLIRFPVAARDPISIALNGARLARVARNEKVSLIHARSRAPAFSALLAARRTGIPWIATYHGVYGGGSPLKRWYNSVMTRSDVVLAPSRFVADHIRAEHKVAESRIVVVPDGVDTARFDPAAVGEDRVQAVRRDWRLEPEDGRLVVLLAARLTRLKGHALAIEAFARQGRDDALLILAGPQPRSAYVDELKSQVKRAGLSGRVRFPGLCADMPAAIAASDLVISPSLVAESFGRCVIEACAMRRPVLASDLGGPAETVEHGVTGWLVAGAEPEDWAAALQTALSQPTAVRAAMGQAGRLRAERLYGLETMRRATFSAYRRALEGRA